MSSKWGWSGLGKVTSPFGYRIHPITGERAFHNGVDLAAPVGTPLWAPYSGFVRTWTNKIGGLQLSLTSESDPEVVLGLAHLSGAHNPGFVQQGAPLARTGNTGRSTGPHLHLTLRIAGQLTDPKVWMDYVKKKQL